MSAVREVRLGDVVKVIGGGTPSRANPAYYGGDIPWVTPKDMKSWSIVGAQVNITREGLDNSSARMAPENSILVVVRSGVLKHTVPIGLNRVPVAINQDMKAVICGEGVHPDYLARALKARSGEILSWVRATTADNFPIDKLKELKVVLPPLAEQRRIADVLDRVDTLRAKRRAALDLLGAARTAAFVHMFGDPILNDRSWKRMALGALVERIHSGRSPICLDRPASEGEWAVLKLGAVTSGEFRPAENKALPVTVAPRAEDEVRAGDILFSRKNTRDLVAACVLVRSTPVRRLMPDLMFRLELKEEAPVVAEYLHALLSYPPKRRTVQDLASGSAGSMPNISKGNLATVAVEVPPLDLQREFASAISSIETAKVVQRRALGELDALFASLQHRAFRGEL
ncbi:restriction endonuclease subunit S [Micromonospora sp. LOL_014]|uniref:restriction endonuclease subunit S n=1 Tax=Micromonospora sp. LOL_014 TaxID=3345415 RepID=UPI003A8870FC